MTDFAEFFIEAFDKYLSKDIVVHIKGLGYFFVVEREERIGTNPQTGEKTRISGVNRLEFIEEFENFGASLTTQFTKGEFFDSLKRNSIEVAELEFLGMSEMIVGARLQLRDQRGAQILIMTAEGQAILKIKFQVAKKISHPRPDGTLETFDRPERLLIRAEDFLKEKMRGLRDVNLAYQSIFDAQMSDGERTIGLRRRKDAATLDPFDPSWGKPELQ